MRDDKEKENAYLTVYLVLTITVLLSLCLVLIEGVRKNGASLQATCATEVSMQSIMAEYHRELLRQYNIFAIDASYGTDSCVKRNTEARLYHYLRENLETTGRDFYGLSVAGAELTEVSILTDGNGAVFRKRAVEAIRDDVGLELLEQVINWVDTVQVNGLENGTAEQEKAALDREIEEYEIPAETEGDGINAEAEATAGKVENPTEQLNSMRKKGILKLVLGEEQRLSPKSVVQDNLVGNRIRQGKVNKGNLNESEEESLIDRFMFQEYLIRYMGCYTDEKAEGALNYQLEYLLTGKEQDTENLRAVVNRLCMLREVANVMHLYTDAEKRGEAELLATTICAALLVPELTPVLHATIMLGWAYGESVHDVKMLLEGKRVPLLKDKSAWYLGLSTALNGDLYGDGGEGTGLSYEDYLRVFMMLSDLDTLTLRAMDIVESDIRTTPGNSRFRLDGCYDAVQAEIAIRGGEEYRFELIREKSY